MSVIHLVLARKPIKGTVAANCVEHGVGGLNIDGCRVDFQSEKDFKSATFGQQTDLRGGGLCTKRPSDGFIMAENVPANKKGRFPANIILSHHSECVCVGEKKVKGVSEGNETVESWQCHEDCPIRKLDEQSGVTVSIGGSRGGSRNLKFGMKGQKDFKPGFGDTGGASRFFKNIQGE